jgi:beta-N-acetylhexosaminidase
MHAVADRWSPGESAVLALKAGCDIVPVCNTHDAQVSAIEGVIRAAESGEIGFKAMDDSLSRVRRLKERYLLPYRDPDPAEARRAAGRPEFEALALEIAERGGEPRRFPWSSPEAKTLAE